MTSELLKNHQEMESKSEIVRGRIIDIAITLENLISISLTDFFAKPDVLNLFDMYIMSDSLEFDKKKQILSSLIKNKHIELGTYDGFSNDLQIIQDLRNILAHTTLNTAKERIENYDGSELQYISFSRRKWQKEITILLSSSDKDKEDIKKNIYSFSSIIESANKIKKAFEK